MLDVRHEEAEAITATIYGWGFVDVNYNVYQTEVISGKKKNVWICPYYRRWVHVIARCFSETEHSRHPTYKSCTVTEDWKYLSNFIKWVDSQPNKDWQGCDIDKDILMLGNKHYSPDTCVFIHRSLNKFILDRANSRGQYMLGVSRYTGRKKPYAARCGNPFTGKGEKIGYYPTEIEAHLAWKSKKHEHALKLADLQPDERVAKRLREMYSPETDWTNK